jgi:dTDP-4-amino-4,6-dideoxygalactose transaminase
MPETTFVNKPVLVDIREEDFTVDVRAAKEELTPRTKAIILLRCISTVI